jgi:hypothetical protein
MIIQGQEIDVTEGGNLKIKIESPYLSAGMIYNFPNKSAGIGINEGIVKEAIIRECYVMIEFKSNLYWIKPSEILKIVDEYSSKEFQGSVQLYIVPLSELHPL